MRRFVFLDLPRELRDLVYEQVFFSEPNIDTSNVWQPCLAYEIQMWGSKIQCPTDLSDPKHKYSSLRQTCQTIRTEYDEMITRVGIIHAETDLKTHDIPFTPRPFIFRLVQRIELELNIMDDDLIHYKFDWAWLKNLPRLRILAIAISSWSVVSGRYYYSLRGWIGDLCAHVGKHVEIIWRDIGAGTEYNGLVGTTWIKGEELRSIVRQACLLQGSMIEDED